MLREGTGKRGLIPFIIVIMALSTFGSATFGAGQGGREFIASQVALVNGSVLTEQELFFTLLREKGADTIDDLVENEIIAGHGRAIGVSLEPTEVGEYLVGAYAPEKLQALLDAFGEDLLDQTVGTELLAYKTVTRKIDGIITEHAIEVSEEEIRRFYIDNLPLWTDPESVRFSLIETTTEADATSAKQRIDSGEAFGDVCRAVSTHPGTRAYGGDIGGLVPKGYSTGERALLEQTAFALGVGEVSRPLQVEGKWYIVMPTEKTEYHEPTLDEMRDTIHAVLLDDKVSPYLEEWRGELWRSAEIEFLYPIYVNTPASSFSPGQDSSFIAPTVAVVNGGRIPEGALLFHLLRQYGSDVIEALIEGVLLEQEADRRGLETSREQAREQLTKIYQADKLAILDAAFTSDALNRAVERELASLQVMGTKIQEIVEEQNIEISDDEILQYYLDNLPRWTRPEMVRFSIIVVSTQDAAAAARARILSGEDFGAVCREVSEHTQTRAYDGDIGDYIPRNSSNQQNKIIEDTAFSLPVGGVSEPFQVGANWFILKVTDKRDAYEPTLGEKREEIIARLLQDRVAPFVFGWRRNLWAAADITVVYPIYADNPSPDFSGDELMPLG